MGGRRCDGRSPLLHPASHRLRFLALFSLGFSFWVYNTKTEQWSKVYHNENADANYWLRMEALEPCPRFAHQLVYDYTTKIHYLFGGNPGEAIYAKARLDDFWELKLTRPTPADILRKTLFLVRRLQFREMCQGPRSMEALRFLQQKVRNPHHAIFPGPRPTNPVLGLGLSPEPPSAGSSPEPLQSRVLLQARSFFGLSRARS